LFKAFGEAYSSGSVQDLHLIPFSFPFCGCKTETPKPAAKIRNNYKPARIKKSFGYFFLRRQWNADNTDEADYHG
jgi:hypothetical protein